MGVLEAEPLVEAVGVVALDVGGELDEATALPSRPLDGPAEESGAQAGPSGRVGDADRLDLRARHAPAGQPGDEGQLQGADDGLVRSLQAGQELMGVRGDRGERRLVGGQVPGGVTTPRGDDVGGEECDQDREVCALGPADPELPGPGLDDVDDAHGRIIAADPGEPEVVSVRLDAGAVDVSTLSWPTHRPSCGAVELREYRAGDVAMVQELTRDPCAALIAKLSEHATETEALEYVHRQRGRLAEGVGFSFVIADAATDDALGGIALWLRNINEGRASLGYLVAPRSRGRQVAASALTAVTEFAWSLPELHRIEALIEPDNPASLRTAEKAGYTREGVLRSYAEFGGTRRDMAIYARLRDEH